MQRIRWYGPTLVLLATVLAIAVAGPEMARKMVWAHTDERITLIRQEQDENPVLDEMSRAFRNVAEVVKPSVVNIQVLRRGEAPGSRLEELLPEFFDRRRDEQREPDRFSPRRQHGHGSGWVYDGQGHIVTNDHVIRNADEIRVEFVDGREFTAEVVGQDPSTDIAVLRIDATDVHPARIAGEQVEQGDIVFAFGSPFRFDFSMSQGIISGRARQLGILGQTGYENFIQTDAAINPGNSGGPLTNIRGEVVGMNTAIAQERGSPFQAPGFQGVGFAIPAEMVVEVADQIIEQGHVVRGFLGISIEDLGEREARAFGLEHGRGVLVQEPMPGLPAAEAGVQAEDIITAVNGQPVETADELRFRIARIRPGTEVELTIFRDGEELTIPVVLAELDDRTAGVRPRPGRGVEPRRDAEAVQLLRRLGMEGVERFTPELAAEMNAEPIDGVFVAQVRRNSLASQAGLRPGMVIMSVMGEPVADVAELSEKIRTLIDGDEDVPVRLRVALWDPREERFRRHTLFLDVPRR